MQDTHDPVNYLRSEIAAYDAGLRPNWESWQREHYDRVAAQRRVARPPTARLRDHVCCELGDQASDR